jgi:nucleoside-diphosphate-sugar epimerase
VSAETPRALVTGATGFIGRRLTSLLLERGWDVHALLRSTTSSSRDLDGVPVVMHLDDGRTPLHAVIEVAAPDVCFHLAGYFAGSHGDDDIIPLIVDNVLFGTRLADALASRGSCVMVNAGSFWQSAGGAQYHPVALYAATKQAFQDIVTYYVEAGELRAVTLKFFDTYGPGDTRPKLINLLLRAALSGESIGLSSGEQYFDLVHVDDAARACLAAADALLGSLQPAFETFAVTSSSPLRVRDFVVRVGEIIGRPIPVVWGQREDRWREMMEPWDVAAVVPGWSPQVSLDDGVRALWQSLAERSSPPATRD